MKRKSKRMRERLDEPTFSPEEIERRYRDVEKRARKKKLRRHRERLHIFEPASATFTELFHEMGSINPKQRHDAARRLAAHCAVVFKD